VSKFIIPLCLFLIMSASCLLSGSEGAAEWETVAFTFPMKVKDEMKDVQFKVQIPKRDSSSPIRGVIQHDGSFMAVAHKHNLAVFDRYDEGHDRGPSIKFLAEAAKACKRPEIEFAGAVGIGLSAQGRKAAQWAGFNSERSLAVILDHSTAGAVSTKPSYDYMNLPVIPGVPMCFNETREDFYQNIDRRTCHYNWCTSAFRDYQQPCTASIYYDPKENHHRVLSREFEAVWLDEVLSLRIPNIIPVGKPYKLTPVTVQTGGLVKVDLAMDGKRAYHNNIVIGPAQNVTKFKEMNFWVPGPKTAAKYIEWVEKNGGKVKTNKGDLITTPQVVAAVNK
jgi:hypothetical protein